jgi:hypothetical protein
MIKDFVPARTGVATGVVVKQHLLERNKYITPQVSPALLNYSESIDVGSIEGGSGGVFEFEGRNKPFYPVTPQQFQENINTVAGVMEKTHKDESEYYDGELKGTEFIATDGEVGPGDDFRPLDGNADDSTRSDLYYTVEYDSGDIVPSNLDDIIDGLAQPADVEDFNYFSPRSYIPRYEGSKHNAIAFGALNRSTGYVPVDPGSIYFTNIVKAYDTSPEYINKTFVSIDKFVTQNSDVYDPRNRTIPQFIDFKHTFKKGDIVDVKLDALKDVRIYDELPGSHSIFRIGRYNTLLATNSSTSSMLPSNFAEGASGSRIGRINMVPPDAIDQGDATIILPVDPAEEIPTPVNFNYYGRFKNGANVAEAYFRGENANTNGEGQDLTEVRHYGFANDIPNNSVPFGFTGYNGDSGTHNNVISQYPDPNSVNQNEEDWSEQGYEYFTSDGFANLPADLANSTEGEYALYRFTRDTDLGFQSIKVKVILKVFIMNYNSNSTQDSVTEVSLRCFDVNGANLWAESISIDITAEGDNNRGTVNRFSFDTPYRHQSEGDYIVAFVKTDRNEMYVCKRGANSSNEWDLSYFEVKMQSNISPPLPPEEPGEPEGLPSQYYLHYYTAEEVPFPEGSPYYVEPDLGQGNAGGGGSIVGRGPTGDDGLFEDPTGMISAVGLEPPLLNHIGDLQILSSSQTDYFSRGPYAIANPTEGDEDIIVIPPSSSRGYDQSIMIPFEPTKGDEIRWAYSEDERRTITKTSLQQVVRSAYPDFIESYTTAFHLDRPMTINEFNTNGQNFIITRINENNSGFMLDTRKKFPDIGDSTTKESYVTPRLISSKLDKDLYSIVRDLSTDEGVF